MVSRHARADLAGPQGRSQGLSAAASGRVCRSWRQGHHRDLPALGMSYRARIDARREAQGRHGAAPKSSREGGPVLRAVRMAEG